MIFVLWKLGSLFHIYQSESYYITEIKVLLSNLRRWATVFLKWSWIAWLCLWNFSVENGTACKFALISHHLILPRSGQDGPQGPPPAIGLYLLSPPQPGQSTGIQSPLLQSDPKSSFVQQTGDIHIQHLGLRPILNTRIFL